MSRRSGAITWAWLACALAIALMAVGCGGRRGRQELRVGYLTNVTNAVPMVASARGLFPADRPVRLVAFSDGPTAVEALLAGDLDVAWVGPAPAINAFVRTGGMVRILAGSASGGASFVLRDDVVVRDPSDLRRAKLAVPQTGNTQDIALRGWLRKHDLKTTDRGGNVLVVPLPNGEIFGMFLARELDGAWVPEPWATRLVREGHGRVYVDEASLWPEGRFPAAVLLVRDSFVQSQPAETRALARTNRQAIAWIARNPAAAQRVVVESLARVGKKMPEGILAAAWKKIEFTDDPMLPQLKEIAREARRIGYLPESDLRGLVVQPDELERPAAARPQPEARR